MSIRKNNGFPEMFFNFSLKIISQKGLSFVLLFCFFFEVKIQLRVLLLLLLLLLYHYHHHLAILYQNFITTCTYFSRLLF
jgi:hypothetical protein